MYSVGQVLFIILNSKQQVVPVQVVEQVVRRTLGGEETTYSVAVPGREGIKNVELNQIDGEIFESIEEVRTRMFAHAKEVIDAVTERAETVAKERFKTPSRSDVDSLDSDLPGQQITTPETLRAKAPVGKQASSSNPSTVKVELADGKVVNVRMPNLPGI